jgi:ribokinase
MTATGATDGAPAARVMDEPAVLAAGTVNADFLMRVDAPLERGASLIARGLQRTSGGRAANVAVMARRLGAPARLFGCIGDDDLAEQALEGPRAAAVDLTALRRVPGDTGLAAILVGDGGAKTMILAAGANDAFTDADGDRLASAVRDAPEGSVLVVDSELSPAALERAFEAAREHGRVTVLDPTRPSGVTDRLLELSDHVTPNADEAAGLTGIAVESPADAHRAARRLHRRGPRHVHVRLPRGGCVTLWPDGEVLLSAPEDLEVVDTTGAGDAFAGTLATAIIAGLPPVDAARLAVAAAACAVTGFGAQESYPEPRVLHATARGVRASIYPRAVLRGSGSLSD